MCLSPCCCSSRACIIRSTCCRGCWQKLAVFSPATYVLTGTRHAVLEGMPTNQLWPYVWPVLLMGVLLVPAGLWVFGQAERYAKRTGKLHRNG